MKRPLSHEIDVQARRLFTSKLPKEWISRLQQDDYGIDYEIEIFKNNQSTGIIFKVQLKGAKNLKIDSNNDIISLPLRINSIHYLVEEVQIPTFLFVADIANDQLYWLSMKGNKKIKQSLQDSKTSHQEYITLHIPIKNNFQNNLELFSNDLKLAQADISTYLICSIDTSLFLKASKDCYNIDDVLHSLKLKTDTLKTDKLEKMFFEGKYKEVIDQCNIIFDSPSGSIQLRFSALFELDRASQFLLRYHEEKSIEEIISYRMNTFKRMRSLFRINKTRLDLRIYSVAIYQTLKMHSLAHKDLYLYMNSFIHKDNHPLFLNIINIARQVTETKLYRNIRRMFNIINYSIKNKIYYIIPELVNVLCENIQVHFMRLEKEELTNRSNELIKYFDDAINLGIKIAQRDNNYCELARLYLSRVLIARGHEKETRYTESLSSIENLPEFEKKNGWIKALQRHLKGHKESLISKHDKSIDTEEQIYRSMIRAMGIDLEKQHDPIANILRIGLKDLNPERVLKNCQFRYCKIINYGMPADMFRLYTAGKKAIFCTKYGYIIHGLELDEIENTINSNHCNKCSSKIAHAKDWKWSRKWQLEQDNKFGNKFT